MRPRLSDNKKRNKPFNFRVSMEEKIRIKSHIRNGKYPSISDFIDKTVEVVPPISVHVVPGVSVEVVPLYSGQ